MIRILSTRDIEQLGFDLNVLWDQGGNFLRIRSDSTSSNESMEYEVVRSQALLRPGEIYGRGERAWSVKHPQYPSARRIIVKDGWYEEALPQRPWSDILGVLKRKKVQTVTVLPRILDSLTPSLTVTSIRHSQGLASEGHIDRVFMRAAYDALQPRILHFTSGLQLVRTIRDAVKGMCAHWLLSSILTSSPLIAHYSLLKAGFLHCAIAIDNICLTYAPGEKRLVPDARNHGALLVDVMQILPCEMGAAPERRFAFPVVSGSFDFRLSL